MKRALSFKVCVCALAMSCMASATPESATPVDAQQLAEGPQSDVIVLLRDQLQYAPPDRHAMASRAAAVVAAQAPVVSELQQGRTRKVHSYSTINAFSTSVSAAEAAHLASHPMVLAVVPDLTIRARRNPRAQRRLIFTGGARAGSLNRWRLLSLGRAWICRR